MQYKILALGAALLAPLACAEKNIDIVFNKWGMKECRGPELGDSDKISDGTCYTFDHWFTAYQYEKPFQEEWLLPIHNDWSEYSCGIIIYGRPNCEGYGWSTGGTPTSMDQCRNVPVSLGGWARSAGVYCDPKGKQIIEGFTAPNTYNYGDYDGPGSGK